MSKYPLDQGWAWTSLNVPAHSVLTCNDCEDTTKTPYDRHPAVLKQSGGEPVVLCNNCYLDELKGIYGYN